MVSYLADKGARVLANGFNVIPIKPGEKAPSVNGWQKGHTTEAQLNRWISNGFASHGLGIPTKYTPFVDLDISYRAMLRKLLDRITIKIGFAPVRVGNRPKRGLLVKLNGEPFRKINSREYRDPDGGKAKVEILADGEQFVAFHIHPDTHKPYGWLYGESPETITVDELPEITREQCQWIVDTFHELMEEEGWPRWSETKSQLPALPTPTQSPGFIDADDIGDTRNNPCGLTEDEIRKNLMIIPNDSRFDERGDWLEIGFAVHHETAGSEFGRDVFYEWSVQHGSHDDAKFEKAWNSFGKRDDPRLRDVTFRYVLKVAKEYEQAEKAEQVNELMRRMDFAKDLAQLKDIAADCRKLEIDLVERSRLIAAFQKSMKSLANVTLGVREAREMVRYRPDDGVAPDWLDGWCYLTHSKQFYNRKTGARIEREAFDAAFGRFAGTEITASKYALDIVKIPVFHMTIYLPAVEQIFSDANGLKWINTYRDTSPPTPATMTVRDLQNVERVEAHFYHLFEDKREIEILISALAYIVRTRRRINWMILLQGAEAIGKTFVVMMMSAVQGGGPHVYKLDSEVLAESHFTEWAEGHLFIFIEELKVHGHRYGVLDKLKTYITDDTVTVHPKGIKAYNVPNTSNYMGATNYRDAIPVGRGDTRYFVLMSRFQSKEAVDQFKAENPTYYGDLFAALDESPGAIRDWLMNYKLHPEFNPRGRAPASHGRTRMIEEAKSDLQFQIENLIAEGKTAGVSDDLIVVHLLQEALPDEQAILPSTEALIKTLKAMQFAPVQERRVKMNRPKRRDFYCWSKNPTILSAGKNELRKFIENTFWGPL